MHYRRKSFNPRAFTLVEILVVIAVIAILIGIAVLGFRALHRGANTDKTETLLGNAASMFAEYDANTALKKQPSNVWPLTGARMALPAGFNIWRDADPSTAGEQRLPLLFSVDADEDGANYQRLSNPVRNTSIVFAEMLKVPGVKSMFTQIPVESTMTVGVPHGDGTFDTIYEPQPILLDGWDNPMVFVPAAGMEVAVAPVNSGDPPQRLVVTSVKTYPVADLPLGVVAPNARPFFVSAGPDGILGALPGPDNSVGTPDDIPGGDDNVYSFQN